MNKIKIVNNLSKKFKVDIKECGNDIIVTLDPAENLIKVSDLKPGQVIKGKTGTQYIFLEFDENGDARILRKKLLDEDMQFDRKSNNFDGSNIDRYLNTTYLAESEKDFAKDGIVEHEVNLLSMDGLDDYGKIKRKISLLPFNIYRRCRKFIEKNMERAWWLIDPDSIPSGYGSDNVQCVDPGGGVGCRWYSGCRAVRPFLTIKSSIFVALVETEEKVE